MRAGRWSSVVPAGVACLSTLSVLFLFQGRKRRTKRDSRREWLKTIRAELYESVLPFWLQHSYDAHHGGFYSCVAEDGSLFDNHKKYTWLNGRAVATLAQIADLKTDQEIAELSGGAVTRDQMIVASAHGAEFLMKHAERADGQVWFCLNEDGAAVQLERKPFSAMFMCLGLGNLSQVVVGQAGWDQQRRMALRDKARQLLDRTLGWAQRGMGALGRPACPGARLEAWNVPMIALNLVEAFIETPVCCHTAASQDEYEKIGDWCTERLLAHILPEAGGLAVENVNVGPGSAYAADTWEGRLVIPGHAIECAWFLLQRARRVGDKELARRAIELLDRSWARGWDTSGAGGGGLLYFVDSSGQPGNEPPLLEASMKLWWPHTEAMIAFLMAYLHTREERHWERFVLCSEWALAHFSDRQGGHGGGEWFGYCDKDGRVTHRFKGGPYKGCFHVPRALVMCEQMLQELVAEGQP